MYTLSLVSPSNDVTHTGSSAKSAYALHSGIRVNGPSRHRDGIRVNRQARAHDGIRVNGPQARYALAG
jgi:hypothetical protein